MTTAFAPVTTLNVIDYDCTLRELNEWMNDAAREMGVEESIHKADIRHDAKRQLKRAGVCLPVAQAILDEIERRNWAGDFEPSGY